MLHLHSSREREHNPNACYIVFVSEFLCTLWSPFCVQVACEKLHTTAVRVNTGGGGYVADAVLRAEAKHSTFKSVLMVWRTV
eukprot:m.412967 g.412967  ORF g.412967 m.412967 type:complete len:82 (+) comp21260_c0_seq7:274-519(+)